MVRRLAGEIDLIGKCVAIYVSIQFKTSGSGGYRFLKRWFQNILQAEKSGTISFKKVFPISFY